MAPRSSVIRKTLVTGALAAGASLGAAGIASAASSSTTSTTSGSSAVTAPAGASPGAAPAGAPANRPAGAPGNPASLRHGPGETLLTGTNLEKADGAARAAVPGATVIRAETDSSGASPYEVHMKKADGSYVTVELNSTFQAIKTVSGFGAGPAGGPVFNGMAPPSSPA